MISLKKIILVESWKTYNLSNNPKILLYDFYVLSYLSTLPISPIEKGFRGNLIGRDPLEIKLDIEHAQNVLLNPLVKKLKSAIFVALTAEIRHVFVREQDFSLFKNNDLFKQYTRYYFELRGDMPPEFYSNRNIRNSKLSPSNSVYKESFIAASKALTKTGKSREAFAELCSKLFKEMDWEASYGGKKWEEIANAYIMLNNASSHRDKQIAIDHAFDLQHNTGTVLNKVKEFQINGNYDWLDTALSLKRDVDSMYKLLPYCSSDIRRLANEVFKIANIPKGSIAQQVKNEDIIPGDIVLVRDQYSDKFGTGIIISIEPTMTTGEYFYNVKIIHAIGKYEEEHTYTLTQYDIKKDTAKKIKNEENYFVHDIVTLENEIDNQGYGTGVIVRKKVDLDKRTKYDIKIMKSFGLYSKNSVHVFYPADIHSKIGKWAFDANNFLLNMDKIYIFDLDDLENTSLIKGKYHGEHIIVKPLEINPLKNKIRCEILQVSNKNITFLHVGQIISLNPKKLYKKANLDINI